VGVERASAEREEEKGLGKKKQAPQGQQESEARKKQKRFLGEHLLNYPKRKGQWAKCFFPRSKSLLRAPPSAPPPSQKRFATFPNPLGISKKSFPKPRFSDNQKHLPKRLLKRFHRRFFTLTDDGADLDASNTQLTRHYICLQIL